MDNDKHIRSEAMVGTWRVALEMVVDDLFRPSTFARRAFLYGMLWAVWQAATAVVIIDDWPSNWAFVKIVAASVIAFVGGVFTYSRNPETAWQREPGK
jgi:hypothetical protein